MEMLVIYIAGILVISLVAGFGFLRSYDLFQEGVLKKNRIKIWMSFVIPTFILMMIAFGFMWRGP